MKADENKIIGLENAAHERLVEELRGFGLTLKEGEDFPEEGSITTDFLKVKMLGALQQILYLGSEERQLFALRNATTKADRMFMEEAVRNIKVLMQGIATEPNKNLMRRMENDTGETLFEFYEKMVVRIKRLVAEVSETASLGDK